MEGKIKIALAQLASTPLETEKNLYLPVFHHSMDDEAINFAKKIYSKNVIPIEICHIAIDGGGLNCISWTK